MRGPASPNYPGVIDEQVAKTGKVGFRLGRIEKSDGLKPVEVVALATSVLDHMVAARDRYVKTADAKTVDWAIQNARVVLQRAGLGTDESGGFAHRDRCMADNIAWIRDQNPGAKIVLWAHNGHVSKEAPLMGSHLKRKFGGDYLNLAFCSSHGEYYAMPASDGNSRIHPLATPPPRSFESILRGADRPFMLVDLRAAKEHDPGSAWLTQSRPFGGTIGAMEIADHYLDNELDANFDLLLFIRDTTPAKQLQQNASPRGRPAEKLRSAVKV